MNKEKKQKQKKEKNRKKEEKGHDNLVGKVQNFDIALILPGKKDNFVEFAQNGIGA